MAKYGKAAQKSVSAAMKKMEKGSLKSGSSGKKVTNPKQAIAIGLSEAREKGAKVPKKKAVAKTVPKKYPVKKAVAKKAAPKKAVAKSSTPKKSTVKKSTDTKQAAPVKKRTAKTAETAKKTSSPVGNYLVKDDTVQSLNTTSAPVEEKSTEIKPVLLDKPVDPMIVTDKKALAIAVTKHDPKHNIRLSGPKTTLRPSGKKPLWR